MRALVTGIAGFAGSHLADELVAHGHEVAGLVHLSGPAENLASVADRVELFSADITEPDGLQRMVVSWEPDVVFHLAAISFVPEAEGAPRRVFEVNLIGTVNVLEAICAMSQPAMLVFVSTSEVYEAAEFALVEGSPIGPRNLYAASKYAAELCIKHYGNLKTCVFRAFNHIGPRQRPNFVVSSFARQVALMEKGKKEPALEVGNLDAARDFTDVRDIVRAYRLAVENGVTGVYNLCSGRAVRIKRVVETLKSLAEVEFEVRTRRELVRSHETYRSFGSYAKAEGALGWKPEIPFEVSISDVLNFWRERV